ncbi:hypothetical protein GMLC_43550 [Geomonas limicola]|uniref:DUF4148 domain-containing protein n=1 Tax=Geomonas limicola TaxID=2740186 RepID=A0A6V8NE03_9BACT|nr:hypothetical protein [Geomonas limicola]GFO70776.1 hypothetical protein GMLC_43550 [Geomonas limicola]
MRASGTIAILFMLTGTVQAGQAPAHGATTKHHRAANSRTSKAKKATVQQMRKRAEAEGRQQAQATGLREYQMHLQAEARGLAEYQKVLADRRDGKAPMPVPRNAQAVATTPLGAH